MYDQFYELKGRPFQLTPDPHFYFESATHRKALSYLGYGLAQGEGFIVITGDIGAGKTTLVGHVMSTIDPARLTAVKLVSTQVEGDDLLRMVGQNFGITQESLPKAQILQRIEAFLHAQARKGLRTLLIVDEAQGLSISAIEELRMLSNFQLGGQSLLQIFLLGQPEFRNLMNSPELEQLRQRVIATHHLEPMLANEVPPYIAHRLSLVGWTGNPRFSQDAYQAIHSATDGVPRRINALMSRVLLLGAIDQLHEIDRAVVEAVAADMGLETESLSTEHVSSTVPVETAEIEAVVPSGAQTIANNPDTDVDEHDDSFDQALVDGSFGETPEGLTLAPLRPLSDEGSHETDSLNLHRIREELDEMRRIIGLSGDREAHQRLLAERLENIEARVEAVEARSDDQETALRRVLSLLVEWVESEEQRMRAA